MVRVAAATACAGAVCVVAVGCLGVDTTGSAQRTGTGESAVMLVPAPKTLIRACHETARAVGYRVPCPTRVPRGLTETGVNGPTGCALHIVGPGGVGACAASWRGWVVGSSTTADEHLVVTASPTAIRNLAKVVNGPAWYPKARVKLLARITVNGWRARAVFVPQATNDGSAFAHHVVLIWTVAGHTYGVGFHDVHGIRPTLELDEELVRNIRLVGP